MSARGAVGQHSWFPASRHRFESGRTLQRATSCRVLTRRRAGFVSGHWNVCDENASGVQVEIYPRGLDGEDATLRTWRSGVRVPPRVPRKVERVCVQWQDARAPLWRWGFDSPHPLQFARGAVKQVARRSSTSRAMAREAGAAARRSCPWLAFTDRERGAAARLPRDRNESVGQGGDAVACEATSARFDSAGVLQNRRVRGSTGTAPRLHRGT